MKTKSIIKGTLITGLTIMVLLTVVSFVFVGCGHRGFHSTSEDSKEKMEWFSGKIADRLDLTADQKNRVEELLTELHDKRGKDRQWRQSVRQDMLTLVRQKQIDQDDINRVIEPVRQHMEEMVSFAGDRIIEFHALLTPAQREKLAKEIENHEHRHWRRCRFNK